MSQGTFIDFPRMDRPAGQRWYIGKQLWARLSTETRNKFESYRKRKTPCRLRIDMDSPSLGDA